MARCMWKLFAQCLVHSRSCMLWVLWGATQIPPKPSALSGDNWELTAESPSGNCSRLKTAALTKVTSLTRVVHTQRMVSLWVKLTFKRSKPLASFGSTLQGYSSFRTPRGMTEAAESHPNSPLCPFLLPTLPHSCHSESTSQWTCFMQIFSESASCGIAPWHFSVSSFLQSPNSPPLSSPSVNWNKYTCLLPASLGKNKDNWDKNKPKNLTPQSHFPPL